MVLDDLIARHYDKDYFGISIEKIGSMLNYIGLEKIGNNIKDHGMLHQKLMQMHEYRIKKILKKHGFNERLLKKYLGWASGTIMLQRCCAEAGYLEEYQDMHDSFKWILRKFIFSMDYWKIDKNYINKDMPK